MIIQLSPQAEALLRQLATYGEVRSTDAVIEEALRLLEEQRRYERFQAAATAVFASLDRGDGAELTPELLTQMRHNAERNAAAADWQLAPPRPSRAGKG